MGLLQSVNLLPLLLLQTFLEGLADGTMKEMKEIKEDRGTERKERKKDEDDKTQYVTWKNMVLRKV